MLALSVAPFVMSIVRKWQVPQGVELDDMITRGVTGPVAAEGRAVAIMATITARAAPTRILPNR